MFIERILFIHNSLPWGTLPLCLNAFKSKCLCSKPCLPVDGHRKEEINTFPFPGWPFQEITARLMKFLLYFLTSPHLFSITESSVQTLLRWLFLDISLPSSWSAGFLNKVIFLASTLCPLDSLASHVASRVSLDSVTEVPQKTKNRITI